jgi:hypothetical protein
VRSTLWLVRAVAVFLLTYSGSGMTVDGAVPRKGEGCPESSINEIQARYKPELAQPEEAVIDRVIFWERMGKVADAKEVFKFKAKKKDKTTGMISVVEKAVSLDKSIVDSEHRAVIEAIFDRWETTGGGNPKHLALMLGTAYRETCGRMLSTVGEACGCTKTCSKDEYKDSRYGQKDSCGRAYFGRGFVQLTGVKNYESVGRRLGIPLKDYPSLAYEQPFAIMMLVDGVKGRWFAGKHLNTYLNDEITDWVRARESVNPGSPNKAATGYLACRFYDAIQLAYKKPAPAQEPAICMKLKNM